MKLLIDASNLKTGGSMTHLTEILRYFSFNKYKFDQVTIVGGSSIDKFKNNSNFEIVQPKELINRTFWKETFWKLYHLPRLAMHFDVVFSPGGSFRSNKVKYVTMCRNMLVFEGEEKKRYGYFSFMYLKLSILKYVQLKSFRGSSGMIFISYYAFKRVSPLLPKHLNIKIINHGISNKFSNSVKKQNPISNYSLQNPYKLLYVSTIDVYKHHDVLIKAVVNIRKKGIPVYLTLIGEKTYPAFKRIEKLLQNNSDFIHHFGSVPYDEIHNYYGNADAFVFASSCENMTNIIIEAMAAGLPIACSNMGPMKEFLTDAGFYFNPLMVSSVEETLFDMMNLPENRYELAIKAKQLESQYSWEKCSEETFKYLEEISITC